MFPVNIHRRKGKWDRQERLPALLGFQNQKRQRAGTILPTPSVRCKRNGGREENGTHPVRTKMAKENEGEHGLHTPYPPPYEGMGHSAISENSAPEAKSCPFWLERALKRM